MRVTPVTSVSAASAAIAVPLVEGEETLTVVPGTASTSELLFRFRSADAIVVMKLGRTFERVRDALVRHLEKDLGPLAMPQMPSTTVPFAVSEFFPSPSETGLTDDRQHAVALSYIVPVRGECEPRQDALQLSWMTPDEALSTDVQDEFEGGREDLIRQAIAHAGWGR